jgi:hypothetical protein
VSNGLNIGESNEEQRRNGMGIDVDVSAKNYETVIKPRGIENDF